MGHDPQHGHSHSHGHGHGHGHDHGAEGRLGLAFALNAGFAVVELVGAMFTNSTAIAADAVHDLGDCLAIGFAWGMQRLARRKPTAAFTYGLRRLSLLGATVNAIVLLVGGLLVLSESVPRLLDPPTPDAAGMMGLAVLGVLVNGAAVLRVKAGTSRNEKVVTLHLLEDVAGWAVVLVVSAVMLVVDLPILDPLLSVLLTGWIGWNAAGHLKRSVDLFLQATPLDVDLPRLEGIALQVPGVRALRHVHVWSLEGENHVLTGQIEVEDMGLEAAIAARDAVRRGLEEAGIAHVTLELATRPDAAGAVCR
jgi:cobalt-zinc-cadmium efflux system protein